MVYVLHHYILSLILHTFDGLNDWLIAYNVQNFLEIQRLDFCTQEAKTSTGDKIFTNKCNVS